MSGKLIYRQHYKRKNTYKYRTDREMYMKMYVGVTDYKWFEFLKGQKAEEVNFWRPGKQIFKALNENELFLFKLHSPQNYIVGGGLFVKYSFLPTYLAWSVFGQNNGTDSLQKLNEIILGYRLKHHMEEKNFQMGCIILRNVFYFDKQDWIPVPKSFSKNIVQGKSYYTEEEEGYRLYQMIMERLRSKSYIKEFADKQKFSKSMTKQRLGQGAFRISVMDAYKRRCAITGEKTLPVLEAAHIKSFAENGPNYVNNGLLLRADFHKLFDSGYITVNEDYRIDVSKRLHEDYGNGEDYYKYHGQKLFILPDKIVEMPSKNFLRWHNQNVFLQ